MSGKKINLAIILGVVAVILSVFSLTKNSRSGVSENVDSMSRILKTGSMEACTVISPPFSIRDQNNGGRSGLMIDSLELIASKINAKVNWQETTWGNAAADLQSGRCDVVAAEFFANVPRAQAVTFLRPPLFYMGNAAIIRSDDRRFDSVQDVSELDRVGLTIAVATGEAGDIYVKENFKNATIKRIDVEASDLTRFALEVSAKRADVAIAGSDVIETYMKSHSEVRDLFKGRPFGLSPVGWAVRQNDFRWSDFLETSLQFIQTQGDFERLKNKYNVHVLDQIKEYKLN